MSSTYQVHGRFAADNAILALAATSNGRFAYADVRRKIHCAPGSLRKAINRMLDQGTIRRLDIGWYQVSHD